MTEEAQQRAAWGDGTDEEPDDGDEWDSLDSNESELLIHEWHDHPALGYHDEAVSGCPSCEARWEAAQ